MASISSFGKYTHVIVRCIPSSFGTLETTAEGSDGGTEPVDLAKAHRQYGVYTGILRQKLGLQVIELAADEGLPCSTLVGDLAVIQGDTALLTRPWVPSRRDEIGSIKKVLEELKLRVVEVTDEGATLDGSDVLFTGREFFVGISKWTNHRGAEMVADAFRDFAVSTIPVSGTLHLRSFCSMAGSDTVVIGSSDIAKKAMKVVTRVFGAGVLLEGAIKSLGTSPLPPGAQLFASWLLLEDHCKQSNPCVEQATHLIASFPETSGKPFLADEMDIRIALLE